MAITVKIEVEGKTESDVEVAIQTVAKRVTQGFREGFERTSDSYYKFEVSGEEDLPAED